jgi:two-component system, LytTR family, sensor kinase
MQGKEGRNEPVFMKPVIFIGASVLLGTLFALQGWISLRHEGYHVRAPIFFAAWGFQFLALGIVSWLAWRFLGQQIQRASIRSLLLYFLPASIFIGAAVVAAFVFSFPDLPLNRPHVSYWARLTFYLYSDLFQNLVIIWCAFFFFRGVGYYQRYRENERTAAQLEIQLANAQISALRMQLNPHFLFNTMNSISSLMRVDIDAADTMLEQLSSLMRITLERGNAQLISLRDEMEFIELYLAMQARRYAGRVEQALHFEPELYDALVPAMLLQPIIENAYVHGLSRVDANGELSVEVRRQGMQMRVSITNSGIGLNPTNAHSSNGHGFGLSNIKSRLNLHYGQASSFSIAELDPRHVQVTILLPVQFEEIATLGAQ